MEELRARIREADRALLAAMNERLGLVAELKRHKASRGVEFVDPEQERRVVDQLLEDNRGPLSPAGLRELYAAVLDVTKREVP